MRTFRLATMIRHAWRVGSARPGVFALLDTVAVGPARAFWQRQAPWYVGRFIERVGGVVVIDGCRLDTNAPAFTTFQRGCFWLHRYEEPERVAVANYLDPDLPVIELGASMGMLSCLINRRLTRPEAHVAVELNPALIPTLERNRALNACAFSVVNAAVAYSGPQMTFSPSEDHLESRVSHDDGLSVAVESVTLGELLDRFGFAQATLVCDIEGMEIDLWQHEHEVITGRIAWIVVELHEPVSGYRAVAQLLEQLKGAGFVLVWEKSWTRVFRNTRLAADPAHLPKD